VTLDLGPAATSTAGVLLLSLVAVEYGGTFLLRILRGREQVTDFQQRAFRAGHAHAGVLVVLGLVAVLYTEATTLTGIAASVARSGVPAAAILLPAGFFLGAIGRGRTAPNRLFALVWVGAAALAAGVTVLGIGLLTAS
jgi:hypothetical protein